MRTRGAFLGIALVAGTLAAQHDRRGRVVGVVRTHDAAPWAGAQVHLLSRVLPHSATVGEPDHLVVETDERGRFRAAIRLHRPYTVWAQDAKPREAGTLMTEVAENVRPGVIVELTGRTLPQPWRRIRLFGAAQWDELRCQLVSLTDNVHIVPVQLDEGALPFDPVAGGRARLEVFDGEDRLVVSRLLDDDDDTIGIDLGARVERRVVVHGHDQDPIAGAPVLYRLRDELLRIGKTGPGGAALLPLSGMVDLRRSGLARLPGGAFGQFIRPSSRVHRLPADTIGFARVRATPSTRVRVLAGSGTPVPNAHLYVHAMGVNRPAGRRGGTFLVRYVDRTDRDGRVQLFSAEKAGVNLDLLITDELAAHIPACRELAVAPRVPGVISAIGGDHDLWLGRLVPVRISALGVDGLAADRAIVRLDRLEEHAVDRTHQFTLDRTGTLTLLLPADVDYAMTVSHGRTSASCRITPRSGSDLARVGLQLSEPWRIRLHVTDATGRVPRGTVRYYSAWDSRKSVDGPVAGLESRRGSIDVGTGSPAQLTAVPVENSGEETIKADGMLEIEVPPFPAGYKLWVWMRYKADPLHVEITEPSAEPIEVVVR